MIDYVKIKIAEKEAEIAQLQAQIVFLQENMRSVHDQLIAYRDILYNYETNSVGQTEQTGRKRDRNTPHINSRISPLWREFLSQMTNAYPRSIPLSDIRNYINQHNPNLADDNVRSQLSVYVSKGWLERTDIGYYRILPEGAAAIGMTISEP